MSIHEVHHAHLTGARPVEVTVDDVESALYVAIWAHSSGDDATAHRAAGRASDYDPGSELARLLAMITAEGGATGVYDSPAAFRAFIRGGGNVGLYEATSGALREIYRQHQPQRVLDIGVGDGLALLPALVEHQPVVGVVEPSAALLAETTAELTRRGIVHHAWTQTAQDFTATHTQHWDLIQSSFALQSLPPHEKAQVLHWVAAHTGRFALVEFDVPEVASVWEPAWFCDCVVRVERGLREYGADRDLVGAGFILPVILGKFGTAARTNYELAIQHWETLLRGAGFTEITTRPLADYWWRPAFLVEAVTAAG
ncbi:class I SAM-dependent methyltransferase [Saccharopolyspora sp. K220]|uniref:class I SAM-dependent methyltransferase n=1 Tax=Saccharopolyspora soli TaxID=2926618 RepID=UPI001F58A39D|nr:class I SAM-dependent methyltransferase [Saccharopolyspora soli]MCI2421044.1 class I SAM-dependent methyltransferase [Saccharopolyspora soli]